MESQVEGADTVGEQVISQDLRGMGERKLHCRFQNCSRASPSLQGIPDTVSPTSEARLGRGWEELLEHTTQQDKLPCWWYAKQLRRTAKTSIRRGPKASSYYPVVFQATPHLFQCFREL